MNKVQKLMTAKIIKEAAIALHDDVVAEFLESAASKKAVATGKGKGVGGPVQGTGGTDLCYCPKCGTSYSHDRGTPCNEMTCSKCNVPLTGVKS